MWKIQYAHFVTVPGIAVAVSIMVFFGFLARNTGFILEDRALIYHPSAFGLSVGLAKTSQRLTPSIVRILETGPCRIIWIMSGLCLPFRYCAHVFPVIPKASDVSGCRVFQRAC